MIEAGSSSAERMDRIYARQHHIYDLTRKYYLLGRDRLIEDLDMPAGATLLEIGCGTGRNLVCAARRYRQCKVFGIDVSRTMLSRAERSIAKARLSGRVVLAQADATSFSPGVILGCERFDRVFTSYVLSMVPQWRAVVEHAVTLLNPGGSFHIVDFGSGAQLPVWLAGPLRSWLAKFSVIPIPDLAAVLDDVARRHGLLLHHEPRLRTYAQSAVLRRSPMSFDA
jgi:S-adenosylmethionine-diacylgycerolhomoserine-N-methlytransferase